MCGLYNCYAHDTAYLFVLDIIPDDLQYGFKAGHSTTQCSFVLEEVVDYYVRNKSPVFVVLLDASRAFDRIQYVKLFKLLLNRGLCSLIARFLALHVYESILAS